jgi:hypothetical protein
MSLAQRLGSRRRRALMTALFQAVGTATTLVVLYYTLPFDGRISGSAGLLLALGLCGFFALMWHGIRGIVRSETPRMRAVQVLATVVPFFVILFAAVYYVMCKQNPAAFSSRLTRTDALYFTVTVLSTVGFGDLVPVTESARVLVMIQMLGDLILIGVGVRALTSAARLGVERRGDNAAPLVPAPPAHVDPADIDPKP